VTVVHQFDHFQASSFAVDEARHNPKIHFIMESTIAGFKGSEAVEGVTIRHIPTGALSDLPIDGVFVFIGYMPNTESLADTVALTPAGEMRVSPMLETNISGVFAAGDAVTKRFRQITTAVADGTIAALAAIEYHHTMDTHHIPESQPVM